MKRHFFFLMKVVNKRLSQVFQKLRWEQNFHSQVKYTNTWNIMATTLLPMSCFLARWGRSSWLWGSSVETWKATWNNLFQGEVYSQNLATIYIVLEPWLPYSSLRWCGCPFVLSLCQDHPQNLGSPWEPLKANWRLNEHDMQFHPECIGVPVTGQENLGRHQGFCLGRCFQTIAVLWPDYVIEVMQ